MTPKPLKKPELPPHIARRNPRSGLIELIDLITGQVLLVQSSERDLLESAWDRLTQINTPEGVVWIEKTINFDYTKSKLQPYSKLLADLICQQIALGQSLMESAEQINIDYATLCRWRRDQKEFQLAIKQAREDRAEIFHDLAISTAKKQKDPRLKVDTYKWAAEKNDPEKFGTKTKIIGDPDAPLQIRLELGVRRPGDAGFQDPEAAAEPVPLASQEIKFIESGLNSALPPLVSQTNDMELRGAHPVGPEGSFNWSEHVRVENGGTSDSET